MFQLGKKWWTELNIAKGAVNVTIQKRSLDLGDSKFKMSLILNGVVKIEA